MFGRAKRGRKSAQAMDTATDSDGGESGDATVADKISPGSAKRKINAKGLEILSNGVVSMRSLDLNAQVPTKTRDAGSPTIFSARLTLSKAYTLITFIHGGKHMPVEKHRDETSRLVILHSTAPYCLSDESLKTIMDAEPDERSAYLIGLAKIAQQVIRYNLYGHVINNICDTVLTRHDVHPSDDVKLHLGLTGAHARKSFMDM